MIFVSLALTLQSLFTLRWSLYSWNSFIGDKNFEPPKKLLAPRLSFSVLLPVRHEVKVLEDTLKALTKIEYPKNLIEIIVLIKEDDVQTIEVAKRSVAALNAGNILLKIFDGVPVNKPHSLNQGLRVAKNDVVVIFDAEDDPHPALFGLINTAMISKGSDVIQAGVQLIDYNSHWYSIINVLEYYFWYKSGLFYFFNAFGAAPLGGNTVFFKRDILLKAGGWDENCLAEDADIGIRISAMGAKVDVLYIEKYATQEETPHSLSAFIKQRTRWNQGFLQVLFKGDWQGITGIKSKALVFYLLISPIVQTLILLYTPIGIYMATTHKFSIPITLITYLPFYMVLVQVAAYSFGFYKFIYEYRLPFSLLMPVKILIVYFPYQILLAFSSVRSVIRITLGANDWEKTGHKNIHRELQGNA